MIMSDKIRGTVGLPQEAYAVLDALANETHRSKADILRLGLAMMKEAIPAIKDGRKVGIAKKGQELDTQFVGIVA